MPPGTGAKRSPDKPGPAWMGRVCSEKEPVTTNGLMEPETRGKRFTLGCAQWLTFIRAGGLLTGAGNTRAARLTPPALYAGPGGGLG